MTAARTIATSLVRAVAALVACGLLTGVALAPPQPDQSWRTPAGFIASAGLPSGLRLPPADAASEVVGLVATDLDADGDLDLVVANAGAQLAVWINDGTGQLSRQRPAAPGGLGEAPAGPAVVWHTPTAQAAVSPQSPGIHPASRLNPVTRPRSALTPAQTPRRASARYASSRSPRAPPTHPFLA